MFHLEFETKGAAFDGCPELEAARIIRAVSIILESGQLQGVVLDVNGNVVGTYSLDSK